MVQIGSSLPEWLEEWLKLPFYEEKEKCSRHGKQYNTIYCVACMKGPVCGSCSHEFSKLHQPHPHQLLRVVVASRRAGIQVKDIKKLLDVSKIEQYSINNKAIVHLNPKKEASDAIRNQSRSCRTCQRSSKLPEFKFCSIACKADIEGRDMVIDKRFERKSGSQSSSSFDIDFVPKKRQLDVDINHTDQQCTPLTFRKRPRKGISYRSPSK